MKRSLTILLVVAVLCTVAGWGAHRVLRSKGHPGLRAFIGQVWRNYPKGLAADPVVLEVQVDAADMQRLEAVVEQARARGVILPEGNHPVDATVTGPEGEFRARIRIKGKLTDHVEGSKWSFRVVAKKDGGFHGMRRFSLQHPGTRNYLHEWLYHQWCAGEGLVALRYGFCRVRLNGEDLGIYAYEEHFGPELLVHNARVNGPILRFDPALFWVNRLNRMQGRHFDEAYAEFQAAAVDAFGTSELLKDRQLFRQYQEALALIDGFRRGHLNARQVFDVDRMARRHALIDLIGGHHAMDWSDVKFHYDPVAQRLAPVSYESFSAFPTKRLAGAYRSTGPPSEADELHDLLFKDTAFFAAYVHHLERVSQKSWLDSAFAAVKPALDIASATLYREFPYKELDRHIYYRNQDAIRRMLEVPKAAHAYVMAAAADTVVLHVVPINSLPLHLLTLRLKDGREVELKRYPVIPCRPENGMGMPVRIAIPLSATSSELEDAVLLTAWPGSNRRMEVEVFPFPDGSQEHPGEWSTQLAPNVEQFGFMEMDAAGRRIFIKPGIHAVDRDLMIPAGWVVHAEAPLQLELAPGVRIISRSPLLWKGDEDQPITVTGGDARAQLFLLGAAPRSELRHVQLSSMRVHQSELLLAQTALNQLHASEARVHVSNSRFAGGRDQLRAEFVELSLRQVTFTGAEDDALTMRGGRAQLEDVVVMDCKGIALKAEQGAEVNVLRSQVEGVAKAIEAVEGALVTMQGGRLASTGTLVQAGRARMRQGQVRVELREVAVPDNAVFACGEGSEIRVNGKRVGRGRSGDGT
ncbi:MAG: CotH kinase family protein [Flavobacteriales bacterium]|nr:CotH kinase family protein [Flavobacteriales bacterium]